MIDPVMASPSSLDGDPTDARADSAQRLLSLREAAELTGLRRGALKRRVRRGDVAVRVIGKGRSAKLRLTTNALADAGLLTHGDERVTSPPTGASIDRTLNPLLEVIREQGTRIAALEEQRFQLAAQLGAAMERARLAEDRLRQLAAPPTETLEVGARESRERVGRERAAGNDPQQGSTAAPAIGSEGERPSPVLPSAAARPRAGATRAQRRACGAGTATDRLRDSGRRVRDRVAAPISALRPFLPLLRPTRRSRRPPVAGQLAPAPRRASEDGPREG